MRRCAFRSLIVCLHDGKQLDPARTRRVPDDYARLQRGRLRTDR
jgi:hypothetical protein